MDHRVEVELMIEYPRTPQLVFSSFPPGRPALISGWLCIPDELSLLSLCVYNRMSGWKMDHRVEVELIYSVWSPGAHMGGQVQEITIIDFLYEVYCAN